MQRAWFGISSLENIVKPEGLSRKIMFWMAGITAGTSLFVTLSTYIFYYVWSRFSPTSFEEIGDVPGKWEVLWIVLTTGSSVIFAGYFGIKLAKGILEPLNSLDEAIRKVASGDLDARAKTGALALGEANELVNDFNELATKLQQITEEQKFWNAAIAHELRTPVTILSGRIQALVDGVFYPDAEQLKKLLTQVNSLGHLIEELRTVGLADAGHLPLQPKEVNINDEVKAVVYLFAERFASSEHIPVIHGACDKAWCDPLRIRQALIALFENAHKHSSPGLITIRVKRFENDCYEIAVEDQGPGVPEAFVPHIFQAFRHAAHKSEIAGSGLGLAVVDAIARAHNGLAKYERLPSGGSRFIIYWKK